ncbi:unnamed protein product [Linum tenue]|uniref:Uncharacterized protein n=1 Tax=Linum tenue TaxID=586396 RepID=A0AAV0PB92_9ROSI|nr:unnamed protein product [Linum tenue]
MAKMVGLVVGLAMLGYCSLVAGRVGASDPDFIPLYVFGGSRGDSGNNNYLDTTVKADSPPYGIDSPTGRPTGRFSNYRNLPDFISTRSTEAAAASIAVLEPTAHRGKAALRLQFRFRRSGDPE